MPTPPSPRRLETHSQVVVPANLYDTVPRPADQPADGKLDHTHARLARAEEHRLRGPAGRRLTVAVRGGAGCRAGRGGIGNQERRWLRDDGRAEPENSGATRARAKAVRPQRGIWGASRENSRREDLAWEVRQAQGRHAGRTPAAVTG